MLIALPLGNYYLHISFGVEQQTINIKRFYGTGKFFKNKFYFSCKKIKQPAYAIFEKIGFGNKQKFFFNEKNMPTYRLILRLL